MKYVTLNNGVKMPILGFGVFQIDDMKECEEAVYNALKAGYRLIDTAASYGNEEAVGRAIKRSGIPREEIFVTTKLWVSDANYEKAKLAFETSLKKLDLEYIDLYLIHQPFNDVYGAWRAMTELYKEGKIKAIGVSNFLVHHLEELMSDCEIKPMVDQIEFHPGHNQKETVEFCKKHGIVVEAWSPLGRGVILENEFLAGIAQKYNKTIAQICLRWIIQQEVVALPKSVTPERIKSNFEVFNFELSEEDMDKITNMGPAGYTGSDPNLGRY